MLVAPVLVGAWPRPTWWTLLLLVVALVAFCALYATGLWLKSGRRARYARPALVHTAVAVAGLTWLVAANPRLLAWAWVFVPGVALSLWASARRSDRSWWNDVVLVALGCAATLVSAGLRGPEAVGASVLASTSGPFAWPPPGWDATDARAAALVLLAYFLGTVVHVKALIRERRNPRVRVASVPYHALCVAAAVAVTVRCAHDGVAWAGLVVLAVAVLALARAWWLPYRRPATSVKAIGVLEVVMTLLVAVAAVALGSVS